MSAWSHLPNAAHIDRVIASAHQHTLIWHESYDADWDEVRTQAQNAVRDRNADWNKSRMSAWYAAWDEVFMVVAAHDAILALVFYDDCAHYLDMPSDKLQVWALVSKRPAAVLLLPSVIAFERIRELETV